MFAALDTNGDGTLTKSEMEAGFNSLFSAWDSSNSGSLTQDQIASGLGKNCCPHSRRASARAGEHV